MNRHSNPGNTRLEKVNAPKLFGVVPLFQIARIYNIDYKTLAQIRDSHHAAPYLKKRHYIVTAELIQSLGFLTDDVIAYEFNVPRALAIELRTHLGIEAKKISGEDAMRELEEAHARKFWCHKDWLLGTHTDEHIAEQLEIPLLLVRNRREELGICEFHPLDAVYGKAG